MAFPKTLSAAKAQNFIVVSAGDEAKDGGFLVSETDLNNIEAHLSASDSASAGQANEIVTLNEQVTSANTSRDEAVTNLATANARIATLETENATLKKAPAAPISGTVKTGADAAPIKSKSEKYRTSYDEQAEQYAKI